MARWRIFGAVATITIAAGLAVAACGGEGDDDDDSGGGGLDGFDPHGWDDTGGTGSGDIPTECQAPALKYDRDPIRLLICPLAESVVQQRVGIGQRRHIN